MSALCIIKGTNLLIIFQAGCHTHVRIRRRILLHPKWRVGNHRFTQSTSRNVVWLLCRTLSWCHILPDHQEETTLLPFQPISTLYRHHRHHHPQSDFNCTTLQWYWAMQRSEVAWHIHYCLTQEFVDSVTLNLWKECWELGTCIMLSYCKKSLTMVQNDTTAKP